MRYIILITICLLLTPNLYAQDQLKAVAKQYLLAGDYAKATPLYKQLMEYNEDDPDITQDYIACLVGQKDYSAAEKYLKQVVKKNKKSPLRYELALVYNGLDDKKKSDKFFREVIADCSYLDEDIRQLAMRFEKDGLLDYSLATYEKARSNNKEQPTIYAEELAVLYAKQGNEEKAVNSLLELYATVPEKGELVKGTLLRLLDKPEKMEAFHKKLEQMNTANPKNVSNLDLMAWLYLQQKNYAKAFEQIKAIDEMQDEQGRRVLGFARAALREKEFKAAELAYQYIIDKGKIYPFYQTARGELLTCMKEELRRNPHYTNEDVVKVENQFAALISEFPEVRFKETIREYADLEVRYKHDLPKAIELMSDVIKANNVDRNFRGRCKLDMGDYQLIAGDIWESTLLYSQVDKEFKQDALGEEARFRNARLSYYTGDFSWAQGQLDVLKASTSELIANDALNLSVLIVENNPPADSNVIPLLMFARADLLEFQNKDEEAILVLDSISNQYPQHPLADNILMKKADMAYKKQDYSSAAMFLQDIVTRYADDVLADDALFNLASINDRFFNNPEEAKRLYEQLIVKYPGSSYVNLARKEFRRLRGDQSDSESF